MNRIYLGIINTSKPNYVCINKQALALSWPIMVYRNSFYFIYLFYIYLLVIVWPLFHTSKKVCWQHTNFQFKYCDGNLALESLTVSVFNNQSVSYNPFYNTHIHCFFNKKILYHYSWITWATEGVEERCKVVPSFH